MFKKLLIPGTLLLVIILLTGCTVAPKPVYRAQPDKGSGVWNNGQELAQTQDGGLEMVMVFDSFRCGLLVFNMEFQNNCTETLTVDPAAFFLAEVREMGEDDALPRYAQDPEKVLLQNDLARSRAVARRETQQNADSFFSFASLVADLATDDSVLTEQQKQTHLQQDQEIELMQIRELQEHRQTMQSLQKNEYLWQNQALRKTTLQPGQSIGGEVLFNPRGLAGKFDVSCPVGPRKMGVRYILKLYPTKPGNKPNKSETDPMDLLTP